MSSIFAGIDAAKPVGDSSYFKPGSYLVRVDRVKQFQNRKGIACVAVEATNLAVLEEYPGHQPHMIGESVTALYSRASDYFLSETKAFAMSALGVADGDEVTAEVLDAICDPKDQVLAGTLMRVDVTQRMKRDATQEEIKAGRAHYNIVRWKSRVWAADAAEAIGADAIGKLYPGDAWQQLLAKEAAERDAFSG